MPAEIRPLFRPDAIRPHHTAFVLPPHAEADRAKLQHWRKLIESGKADQLNETKLLPDFLTDIFGELLGYTGAASGGDRYTISREENVAVDGKVADAVLGDFTPAGQRFVVAVEGKGTKDPLDRPFAGRKKSAVDQALGYAVNLKCDWYIVTSMRQTRLYHKGADQSTYEVFNTVDLATDEHQLRKFVFLLGAERVVNAGGFCHLPELLKSSEKIGRELMGTCYESPRKEESSQRRWSEGSSRRIRPDHRPRPPTGRRGRHPRTPDQRRRQRSLRPDARGNRPDVGDCTATHAARQTVKPHLFQPQRGDRL